HVRVRPLRHRQEARLPAGHRRAGHRPRRPGARVPGLPVRPGPAQETRLNLIPLEDARRRVLAGCLPLHPRAVPIAEALGCVTSIALTAEEDVPPFANTAMDGVAARAGDTAGAPVTLRVVATLAAGADPSGMRVEPGTAVRI